ncbi:MULTISPECIES: T9SS C-terminal target domain-containing protein [Spirosoma]|uniref:T9SS C-terminal target domain-containing protein n=1 Tax=Spirosoma liriopis TaxID=2937440 RepID=A0ABT0HDQ4_9BACT|nr:MULTISPECIES: T9SS C-terminal target domain-containing protein [Spirosoma]MCK8490289.1 T9SS C-terminal target domain-containing protein [Spirosoma liriopis]UHG89664.1 T9SS C-terminal target domain-containing protein [Spirosoma oryzicola]
MKQFRLSIAVLLSVWGLAGMGDAKADNGAGANGVKIEKSEQKKVRVYTPTTAPVEVAIIDADGNLLYRGLISKKQKGATSFNLNSLPDGQYFLTAGNNAWWLSQGLTIKGNALSIDERNLQQVMEPTVAAYEKNKFEVNLPAKNVEEANVAIYDSQNMLVQTDSFKGSVRRFDLSALPDGAYTFVVGPTQKQFSTRVAIKH